MYIVHNNLHIWSIFNSTIKDLLKDPYISFKGLFRIVWIINTSEFVIFVTDDVIVCVTNIVTSSESYDERPYLEARLPVFEQAQKLQEILNL